MLELSNVWAWRGLIKRSLEPLGSCDPKVLLPFRVLLLLHCMLSGDRQASFWPGASRESIPLGLVLWPHEFQCYMVERVMPCVGLNIVCARTNVCRILILSAERWKVVRRRLRPEAALSSGNRSFLPRNKSLSTQYYGRESRQDRQGECDQKRPLCKEPLGKW